MGRLKNNYEHSWREGELENYDLRCSSCLKPWDSSWGDPPQPPDDCCPKMKQTRLKSVSDDKHRKRTDSKGRKHTYGPYFEWASKQPCIVCGKTDGAPADHLKTVGAGGKDKANCLPVCADHQDRHDIGIDTWSEEYGFTRAELQKIALETWERYENEKLSDN